MSVVVVGAGISGLAAATFLPEPPLVLEAASEPGGNVRTDTVDGRILDRAANGWLDSEPAMDRLLARVGLAERTVPASDRFGERWVFADGRMHAVPSSVGAMVRTRLLRRTDKLRLLAEPFIRRGHPDQSVGTFAERRLGRAFVDRFVGPMVAGIYAADPYDLSLGAALPRMAELEREHRSLFLAMLRLRRGGAPRGRLQTLPGGAGELTATLAAQLGDRLRCGTEVNGLARAGDGWTVQTAEGAVSADQVVLACPAPAQAALLEEVAPPLAHALGQIAYAPIAVVITAWPRDAWERRPRGFGVLMARGEPMGGVLGCVFTSEIFPHQAREDELLFRTMIGGGIHPAAAALDESVLLDRTRTAFRSWFGPERSRPRAVITYRHRRGIPGYGLGHLDRVASIRAAEDRLPGLFLTGNHLLGIGVKDCVRSGEEVASRVVGTFAPGPQLS